ncbi:MAG TPA: hypothetical protein PK280_11340 [Planctomycetota bacterium]|nr:hypothetical protein [Planctomycetota bacterium]
MVSVFALRKAGLLGIVLLVVWSATVMAGEPSPQMPAPALRTKRAEAERLLKEIDDQTAARKKSAASLLQVASETGTDLNVVKPRMDELNAEIKKLDAKRTELKAEIDRLDKELARPENLTLEERLAKLEKEVEAARKADQQRVSTLTLKPNVGAKLYGYFKFDASWDDGRVDNGNYARWAESQAIEKKDPESNMTANQSRLGLTLFGTDPGPMKPSATLEVDLYGSGTAENKPEMLVRQAYMQLDFPDYQFSVIAGQTSDVISPLNPSTLNYTVLWWNGNVGYRRPQLRLTKGFTFGPLGLELAAAATRNIGHDNGALDPGDTGEDAGTPGVQWRSAISFPSLTEKPVVLGASGHWAREEYDTDTSDEHYNRTSNSVNLDLSLPITRWLALKGECYSGRNMDSYLGGIGQGINATTLSEIRSKGCWGAANLRATSGWLSRWDINAGVGLDDPNNDDLGVGARSRNFALFGNATCDLGRGVSAGIEYMHLETDYLGQDDPARVNRVQFSLIYKF